MKASDNVLLQFIRFGIVGISNTVIGYLLNIGTLFILSPLKVSWDYIAGNLVSFVLGVLWVFWGNYKFVFRMEDSKVSPLKILVKTYIAYAFSGLILTNIFSWFWIEQMEVPKFIVPAINLVFTVPVNFLLNKFWAFKKERRKKNG